jgi:hypothetical protein
MELKFANSVTTVVLLATKAPKLIVHLVPPQQTFDKIYQPRQEVLAPVKMDIMITMFLFVC